MVGMLLLAGLKLVDVQAVRGPELSAESAEQRITRLTVPAGRGSISDRNGTPLAFSVAAKALVANPLQIARDWNDPKVVTATGVDAERRKQQIATGMAQILGSLVDPATLLAQLNSGRSYVVLAPMVDPQAAQRVRDRFPEIAAEDRESRQYPAGPVAANVVGVASWSADEHKLRGRVGLESSENGVLSGSDGYRIVDTAEGSNAVIPGSQRAARPATPGSDVQLTLDSDLQYTGQRELSDYVRRTGSTGGRAAVLEAAAGDVLALASTDTFDPQDLGKATSQQLGDPAITTPFEPGSVNKIVTMSAAIEYGLATPATVVTVPPSLRVADKVIHDAWPHGTLHMTLTGVLAMSSNIGTLLTAQKVGANRFSQMLARFGLGQRTGVRLPGESAGRVPPRSQWSGTTFANLPIGQGLSMTVLQLADMYQAIANDGVRIPPRIIEATVGPDGVRHPQPQPAGVRVVSPQTAQTVRRMLEAVTQDAPGQRGTGPSAAIPGFPVAGKTGTAQQVDPRCGCYAARTYWVTFAGMLPADHPRFVVGIMLDAPSDGSEAGQTAAPLFHDIASYLAQRENIPASTAAPPVVRLVVP